MESSPSIRSSWSMVSHSSRATTMPTISCRSTFMERPKERGRSPDCDATKPCRDAACTRSARPHRKPVELGAPKYLPPKHTISAAPDIHRIRSMGYAWYAASTITGTLCLRPMSIAPLIETVDGSSIPRDLSTKPMPAVSGPMASSISRSVHLSSSPTTTSVPPGTT